MEVALKWKGYGISIRILSGKAASRAKFAQPERIVEPRSAHDCSQQAHRDHLLASGSRYVGPIR